MKVDVKDLLVSAGMEEESFYPGKKVVKKFSVHGDHKSHCMVFTWHDKTIRAELKAGLSGHTLDAKELKHFPVSFQAPTYLEVLTNENFKDDDDEGDEDARGSSGKGGGKKPAFKKEDSLSSMGAFTKMADGVVSTVGEITKFVIMGKEIAKEAYGQAFENLKTQLSQAKVMALDLMKGVSDIIHKATPGGGLSARGDETIKYQYDAEKTAPMFGGMTPS